MASRGAIMIRMTRPLIGITVENVDSGLATGKYESNVDYSRAVVDAGGLPVLMSQDIELAPHYVERFDGILLTGGRDIRSESFGIPAHPLSCCMEPERQAFELALLNALDAQPKRPVLGICLGMQLMAMHAGGRMNQHLPDTLANAADIHQDNHPHPIVIAVESSVLLAGVQTPTKDYAVETVISSHHQGVVDAGRLRVIATSADGVIEAIDDPERAFYLGVQWHPERSDGLFNRELIKRFVHACVRRHA